MEIPVIPSPMPPYARQAASDPHQFGTTSPEGVVTASPGITYLNTTDNSLWVKKTGTSNTGWLQMVLLGADT